MTAVGRLLDRLPFAEEDRGKALGALALACLTLLAAIVAALQTDAGMHAQRGKRETDRLALEAAGRNGGALLRIGTSYGVWRRWFEQTERSNYARDAAQADPDQDDRPVLDALADIDYQLSEWVRGRTDLLQPPYYDPETFTSDFQRYEADVDYAPRVLAQERFEVEDAAARAWDARGTTYVTILTVVAVALFFVGLGANLQRPARPLLASGGVLLGMAAGVWAASEAFTPVHRVPDEAIAKVAEARRESYLAYRPTEGAAGIPEPAALERALALADDAIRMDPAYEAAYAARAEARLVHGEAARLADGRTAASDELLRLAIADYSRAVEARPGDFAGWANLGWSAFLTGDLGRAAEATDRALALSPADAALHVQRAMIHAGLGEEAEALRTLEAGLDAAATEAIDSGTYQLALTSSYLRSLAAHDATDADVLLSMERRITEAQVAIAVTGSPDAPTDAPQLDGFEMVALRVAPDVSLADGMPVVDGQTTIDPDGVGYRLTVRAADVAPGSVLSARVTVNGFAAAEYDVDVPWPTDGSSITIDLIDPYGRAAFWLRAGAYRLQLYVDGALRGTMSWEVPEARGPQLDATFAEVIAELDAEGMTCRAETPDVEGHERTVCEAASADGAHTFTADFTSGPDGELVRVLADATAVDGSAIRDDASAFFARLVRRFYGDVRGEELVAWLDARGTDFGQVRVLGSYVRTFGGGESQRSLEILP